MKKEIIVQNVDELSRILKKKVEGVSFRIVEGIKEAIDDGSKEAIVFEVTFQDTGHTHAIYYEEEVWEDLLDSIVHNLSSDSKHSNTVIDAYEVLKELRSK